MEEIFCMEWNMEEIFRYGMEDGMEKNCRYGIWKNRLPFHSITCPGLKYHLICCTDTYIKSYSLYDFVYELTS